LALEIIELEISKKSTLSDPKLIPPEDPKLIPPEQPK
jgi:hypothetical protein